MPQSHRHSGQAGKEPGDMREGIDRVAKSVDMEAVGAVVGKVAFRK